MEFYSCLLQILCGTRGWMFLFCCTFEKRVQASWNLHYMVQTNTLWQKRKSKCFWLTVLKKLNLCSRRSQRKPEILTDTCTGMFLFVHIPTGSQASAVKRDITSFQGKHARVRQTRKESLELPMLVHWVVFPKAAYPWQVAVAFEDRIKMLSINWTVAIAMSAEHLSANIWSN